MPILLLMLAGGGIGYYIITRKKAIPTSPTAGGSYSNAINSLPPASGGNKNAAVLVNTSKKIVPHLDLANVALTQMAMVPFIGPPVPTGQESAAQAAADRLANQ